MFLSCARSALIKKKRRWVQKEAAKQQVVALGMSELKRRK